MASLTPAALPAICPQKKTAIVLFNLGGPDSDAAVQPFLFNLFNDPAIIGLPNPFRWLLAQLISKKRAPTAQKIYDEIGGKSPILENTLAQANALQARLHPHGNVKTFMAMRYWNPLTAACAQAVKDYQPDHIILLPLYPQFSTTTTGSSFKEWSAVAKKIGLNVPTSKVCCYPAHPEFITSHAQLIRTHYEQAAAMGTPRILFSAHGLPEKIIKKGDPYQMQVEMGTRAVLAALNIANVDYVNCYQSRVGPLKWIGPATTDELARAGRDGVPVVLVPIAFVSEHSETLVELDIEYAEMAHEHGVTQYHRVPTLSVDAHYIEALAQICLTQTTAGGLAPNTGERICGREWSECPCKLQGLI
jgi:protoporphyrin/coproporphyrin ferrochelatase